MRRPLAASSVAHWISINCRRFSCIKRKAACSVRNYSTCCIHTASTAEHPSAVHAVGDDPWATRQNSLPLARACRVKCRCCMRSSWRSSTHRMPPRCCCIDYLLLLQLLLLPLLLTTSYCLFVVIDIAPHARRSHRRRTHEACDAMLAAGPQECRWAQQNATAAARRWPRSSPAAPRRCNKAAA